MDLELTVFFDMHRRWSLKHGSLSLQFHIQFHLAMSIKHNTINDQHHSIRETENQVFIP